MNARGLFLGTVIAFLSSGFLMAHAGWFEEECCCKASPHCQCPEQVQQQDDFDPMNSSAAWRYRNNQSSNWRVVTIYR